MPCYGALKQVAHMMLLPYTLLGEEYTNIQTDKETVREQRAEEIC
jgi:hypothetical protein